MSTGTTKPTKCGPVVCTAKTGASFSSSLRHSSFLSSSQSRPFLPSACFSSALCWSRHRPRSVIYALALGIFRRKPLLTFKIFFRGDTEVPVHRYCLFWEMSSSCCRLGGLGLEGDDCLLWGAEVVNARWGDICPDPWGAGWQHTLPERILFRQDLSYFLSVQLLDTWALGLNPFITIFK